MLHPNLFLTNALRSQVHIAHIHSMQKEDLDKDDDPEVEIGDDLLKLRG